MESLSGRALRLDSYIYCYTFDKQLLQEWEWSERYPEQPEILRYLNHVADRFDLRKDMQFGTRVSGAAFDEKTNLWMCTDKGEVVTARYAHRGVGSLSHTNMPQFKGLEQSAQVVVPTSRFPHTGVDFTSKRVRRSAPATSSAGHSRHCSSRRSNSPCSMHRQLLCAGAQRQVDLKWSRHARPTMTAWSSASANRSSARSITHRSRRWKHTRGARARVDGWTLWLRLPAGNYQDMFFSQEANDLCADYIKRKIRKTVHDLVVAEKLIPKGHAYGTKRQPLDTNYYETFNKYNAAGRCQYRRRD